MPEKRPDELVIDELTDQLDRTRRLLTQSPEDVARRALDSLAGPEADADARIAARMARTSPLAHSDRFPAAHRLVIHSLEVLDGEGSRNPTVPRLWLATPVVALLVEFVANYIVQSYAKSIIERLRTLYARREAQSAPGSDERHILARTRVETDRLVPTFSGGGSSGILLIAGGASLPAALSGIRLLGGFTASLESLLVSFAIAIPIFVALSWILLRGAAVARRRARLIMATPLLALWETIGNCGQPPEDDSATIATIAIVLSAVVWVAIPVAALIAYALIG